ncbi:uncharacterized protein PV09_09098 [Verruconis gallopava]|uniref:Uncharacterized protein n=1 Tax=Verruconis gallopava TaxID=253628 RepID=A0A0D1ZYR9_9PEZI|nr:uncharacterized protein PV09_09098 [Verruconis gallopava]KIV99234.1 hypothetical protein PV09_09098 [Verruconis gallopava]
MMKQMMRQGNLPCTLYSVSVKLIHHSRIGFAIERFIGRRKFTQQYQKCFGDFLQYGGVYPASRIGQGESKKQIKANEEISKHDKLELCASYDVDWVDKLDDSKWVIDFAGVVKAYLSTYFAEDLDDETPRNEVKIDNQCNVLTSFYNYLLYHNVCPEYKEDILAARSVSEEARQQLKTISRLSNHFPSPFNKACSVLFGGEWQSVFGYDVSWAQYSEDWDQNMPYFEARVIVGAGFTALAEDTLFNVAFPEIGTDPGPLSGLKFTDKRIATLDVVDIERATDETRKFYETSGLNAKQVHAAPIGKLICNYWHLPMEEEWDSVHSLLPEIECNATYTFWLEDYILEDCFIGMKMRASIQRLGAKDEFRDKVDAIWILDSISRIYCSFATFLTNELCRKKFKGIEWTDEVALLGCAHKEAEKARLVWAEMKERMDKESQSDGDGNEDARNHLII